MKPCAQTVLRARFMTEVHTAHLLARRGPQTMSLTLRGLVPGLTPGGGDSPRPSSPPRWDRAAQFCSHVFVLARTCFLMTYTFERFLSDCSSLTSERSRMCPSLHFHPCLLFLLSSPFVANCSRMWHALGGPRHSLISSCPVGWLCCLVGW